MDRRLKLKNEPWEIVRSRYIIDDQWLTLRVDDCLTSDGKTVSPYYVLEYPPWVNVVALTPDKDVVVIKQYRHGIRQIVLELPGGAVDKVDNSIVAAARRELEEETGYIAEEFTEVGTISANPVNHTNNIHCFLAFNAQIAAAQTLDSTEQIEVLQMPFDELVERASKGQLRHADHVTSLFYTLKALNRI